MSDPTSPATENEGNYVVVARRYRPRGFSELVGQEHVGRALTNAIETGRVGHAYLFTGARGVGKTSTARIFAKALNDPAGPTATPDNTSDVALAIDAGEDVDVIEIDGASNRGIDEIRSLRANVGVRPSRSRYKIYIIDEVHMLTPAAFNALLKTLEEPPEHVKFIFCTTDPEKIPITVLSRCQRFDFAPVETDKIVARLREIVSAESADADDAALELIARRAAGSLRDSQSLLEQVLSFSSGRLTADDVHSMLGTADDQRLLAITNALAARDAAAALRQLDEGIDAGVDAGRLAEQLLGFFRDLMATVVGCDASLLRHTSASTQDQLKPLGETWGLQTVLAAVGLIDQTLARIRFSVHARVLLEATLIQICHLPDLQNIADLAAASGVAESRSPTDEKKKPASLNESPEPPSSPVSNEPAGTVPPRDPVDATAPLRPTLPDNHAAGESAAGDKTPNPIAEAPTTAPAESSGPESSGPEMSGPESAERESSGPRPQPVGVETWDQRAAERVWSRAVSLIESSSMTETLAKGVQSVRATGDGKLEVVYPHEAGLSMKRADRPEHRVAIESALAQAAGRKVILELRSAEPATAVTRTAAAAPARSRRQQMQDIETNELVQSCMEVFEAQIVRIDNPR